MAQAYFIAGTDTEIGKTTVAAGFLYRARQMGWSTAASKPVASDCQRTEAGLRNADALTLQAQCHPVLDYELINPYAFAPAIAPHLAAQEVGQVLAVPQLVAAVQPVLMRGADFTLVEGAGGWRVPLSLGQTLAEVPVALGLPVILVVGIRLGCINHALLTAEAIVRDGLQLAGWVANVVDPKVSHLEANLATLKAYLPAPCLGQVPHLPQADPASVAPWLQLPRN